MSSSVFLSSSLGAKFKSCCFGIQFRNVEMLIRAVPSYVLKLFVKRIELGSCNESLGSGDDMLESCWVIYGVDQLPSMIIERLSVTGHYEDPV